VEFGLQFFPVVDRHEKPPAQYWSECLDLSELGELLGYTHVRTVEHYFHRYGGLSPSPLMFLAAAAMRTKKSRLISGACLPAFNHPLKLASEIGLVDAISGGRLEIGLGRAFLPLEFVRLGVSLDESRARFDEGVSILRRLIEEESVSFDGRFHRFKDTTTYPRVTQKPFPPFWIAAVGTPETFANAGKLGCGMMGVPMTGGKMNELLGIYRDAWKSAGHPGNGRVMLAFHMYCAESEAKAREDSEADLDYYLSSVVEAASDWTGGGSSTKDYPGYDKLIAEFAKESWQTQVDKGVAWIGTPKRLVEMIREYARACGGIDVASMQVNFGVMSKAKAEASMRLFARDVMPKLADI
jgi:alkanesulfonate monooxygenase SsuD/methylene tetrahydromethanopterin reductase-like flavin-dependent oxidoreductase (luciferase family)